MWRNQEIGKDKFIYKMGTRNITMIFRINATTEGSPFYREYYKLQTGKKSVEIQHQDLNEGEDRLENWGFYIGNSRKKVSSAVFYKNLKKYVGTTKMTQIYMHNNTGANRKKFIK